MKIPMIFIAAILLTGCGKVDRMEASLTGSSTVCVDGVKYIQFTSGASVKYDKSGKIQTCEQGE